MRLPMGMSLSIHFGLLLWKSGHRHLYEVRTSSSSYLVNCCVEASNSAGHTRRNARRNVLSLQHSRRLLIFITLPVLSEHRRYRRFTHPLFAKSLDEAALANAESPHRDNFESNTLPQRASRTKLEEVVAIMALHIRFIAEIVYFISPTFRYVNHVLYDTQRLMRLCSLGVHYSSSSST